MSEPRARSRIELVLLAAVADNGVIGRGGTLPWRLKSDMRHFRAITWGKPVVAGRATFLSFTNKPLPGRTNIVLRSRSRLFCWPPSSFGNTSCLLFATPLRANHARLASSTATFEIINF